MKDIENLLNLIKKYENVIKEIEKEIENCQSYQNLENICEKHKKKINDLYLQINQLVSKEKNIGIKIIEKLEETTPVQNCYLKQVF